MTGPNSATRNLETAVLTKLLDGVHEAIYVAYLTNLPNHRHPSFTFATFYRPCPGWTFQHSWQLGLQDEGEAEVVRDLRPSDELLLGDTGPLRRSSDQNLARYTLSRQKHDRKNHQGDESLYSRLIACEQIRDHFCMSLIQSAPNLSFRAFIRPDSMTGQAPVNYMHDAGNFGDSNIHASGIPVHNIPLDLEHFLMDQNPQNLPDGGAHMPQTQFIDFSYPFADGSNGVGLDVVHSQADQRQNMFGGSARGSFSEHRGSIVSIPGGRASFSSNGVPMMVGHTGSLDGSDGNSPENARQGVFLDGPGVDTVDTGSKSKDDKDDLTPAWSELKTKAGKERKRLPLACIACRRKKIRCSGEKPACKHCLKSRIPCVYKVTTRKAAPRTDYMAMLDKRLKRMEDRIIKIVPKDEQDTTSVTRGSVKPLIPGTVPVRTTTQKKRAADEAFGAELEAWARPNMSDAAGGHSNILRLQEAEETRLLSEGAEALPPPDIQEHLAEVFFDNLYGQAYHLLHKPSYMRKLR